MIKNYFKIAVRNLLKYKTYSLTNILGLTAGLTACMLIFLWLMDELSFDRFHQHTDRIYKVMINDIYPDGKIDTYESPTVLIGDALHEQVPEVEDVSQTSWNEDMLIRFGEKKFVESGLYADPNFFRIFSFPIIAGDKLNPYADANSISISETLAHKLFNQEDPLGKTVTIGQKENYTVASVFRDPPQNSSLQFDFLIPFEQWKKENTWANHWRSGATQAFVTLHPGSDFVAADGKVRKLIHQNCNDCSREAFLYPFSELYLHGKFENGKARGGRISQVLLFGGIAIIILVMACFNFTNLATARASTRNREIGVRKAVGAGRFSIALQFLGEATLVSMLSMFFAIFLVILLLPLLNDITGKTLHLDFNRPGLVAGMILIPLICGLMSGIYPAFYLSSLRASIVLKSNANGLKAGGIRKALTVAQFTVSIILIIGSLVIYQQLNYILKKDLGFNKDQVVVIPQRDELSKNYTSFRNDLLQTPSIAQVALVGSNVFRVPITTTDPVWPGKPANSSRSFKVLRCDEGFLSAMHIQLVAGRNFRANNSDSSNYIVNEKAMLAIGLTKDNVIGSRLEMWNGAGEIIGLTGNFANGNLRQDTEPLILMFTHTNGFYYYIKPIAGANPGQTLARIEAITKKYVTDYPFEYSFLESDYHKEYRSEAALGKLSFGFTLLAVIICCLGLLGLVTFAAEQRKKEIGVRKVFGATVPDILFLLSRHFISLVLIAIVVASPLAYLLMNRWLQDYSYRVNISWWIFPMTGLICLFISALTICTQAIRAAFTNPVKTLRSE